MTATDRSRPTRWTRDYVFDILRELEVGYLFGVPGTNEIPIIDGCDIEENRVRYIECPHENIALGAAAGYARMTGRPGVVMVHVTPGVGHALGNLFNACRSHDPVVVLAGQQQNELVTQEPLLASNLVQLASQYTKWSHELRSWKETPLVLQRAFKEALAPPAGPVFVSLPWDFLIHEIRAADRVRGVTRIPSRFGGDPSAVARGAELLGGARHPVVIAGDAVGYADAWPELQRLAEQLGAPVYVEGFSSVGNFPNSDYHWQGELPGDQQQIQEHLAPHDVAFLCGFGSQAQLAVYKYSDGPLIPDSVRQVYLDNNTWNIGKNHYGEVAILGDVKATLPALSAHLDESHPAGAEERNRKLREAAAARADAWDQYLADARKADAIEGVLVADALRETIAELGLEKRFVYVHEAVSDGASFQQLLPLGNDAAAPTSYYCVAGGSLGWSMPASLGIKLAGSGWQGIRPDLVVNAVGDGSSLFYPQVYWAAAHHTLPILYIVMNNREYHTLQLGLGQVVQAYGDAPGYGWRPVTMDPDYLTIRRPELDYVALAKAFGIHSGATVDRPDDVRQAVRAGVEHVLAGSGAYVLDVRMARAEPAPPATAAALETAAPAGAARGAGGRARAAPPPLDIYHHLHQSPGRAATRPIPV